MMDGLFLYAAQYNYMYIHIYVPLKSRRKYYVNLAKTA